MNKFMDDFMAGRCEADAIYDHIKKWDGGYAWGDHTPDLPEWLGMTDREYKAWHFKTHTLEDLKNLRQVNGKE